MTNFRITTEILSLSHMSIRDLFLNTISCNCVRSVNGADPLFSLDLSTATFFRNTTPRLLKVNTRKFSTSRKIQLYLSLSSGVYRVNASVRHNEFVRVNRMMITHIYGKHPIHSRNCNVGSLACCFCVLPKI